MFQPVLGPVDQEHLTLPCNTGLVNPFSGRYPKVLSPVGLAPPLERLTFFKDLACSTLIVSPRMVII
jgi:hypothetical protein